MKKTVKLAAMLCALVLLMGLAGCDDKTAPTPKYETIAVEMPDQQADVAGEKIVKAGRNYYGLWMLTDEHNLYSCTFTEDNQPDITTLTLMFRGVQDIQLDGTFSSTLSVLFDDGSYGRYNTLEMDTSCDRIMGVVAISYGSILLEDGTVQYYQIDYAPEKTAEEYSQTAWHTLAGIKAKAIIAGEQERILVLDENDTLWNCSKEDTNDQLEVAQNVTDFCYSSYNKMRYCDDIWYRTADGGLYHHHYGWGDPIGTPDTPEEQLPATDQYDLLGTPVATEDGNVLLQQEDGTYLFLQANSEVQKVYSMPLKGVYAEGSDFRYMIAGTDGRLYYHSDADTDPRNPMDEVNWVMELPEKSAVTMNESITKASFSDSTVWVLTDFYNLYRIKVVNDLPDTSTMTLVRENVQDFVMDRQANYLNILTRSGKMDQFAIDKNYELRNPLDGVTAISDDAALMQDGTVEYYRDGWHHIEDTVAKKIISDGWFRVLVLDENDTLWNYSMEDGSRVEVAQEVADFCYSAANKMTYHSYIWYATKDGSIYCNRYLWFDLSDEAETIAFPTLTGIPVDTAYSSVLLQQQDGSYLYFIPDYDGNGTPKMTAIPIRGTYAFLGLSNYSIVGIDDLLYFHQDEYPDERYGIYDDEWVLAMPGRISE